MHYLEIIFLKQNPPIPPVDFSLPKWTEYVKVFAPVLTMLAAVANLLLAYFVFKFVRAKHDKDRNIKWFQELVYSTHKHFLIEYFESMYNLNEKIPSNIDLTEDQKIEIINVIKNTSEKVRTGFVNILKYIAPKAYSEISTTIDNLTDDLTNVIDNDELKLYREAIYQREIVNRISNAKNKIFLSIFKYEG